MPAKVRIEVPPCDLVSYMAERLAKKVLQLFIREGAMHYQRKTGRRCPGSNRTKRLLRKRLKAIMTFLQDEGKTSSFAQGGPVGNETMLVGAPPQGFIPAEPIDHGNELYKTVKHG